jgi:hypothetical protein
MRLALALSTSLLVASIARADLAPPPGYDEPCTLEKVQKDGQDCKLCKTYHGNPPDHCSTEAGEGYSQSCRTSGASVWSEVWCKPAGGAAPSPSPTPASTPTPTSTPTPSPTTPDASVARPSSGSGCALAPTGAAGHGQPWLYGLAFAAALTAASRRRSRSSRA